MPAIQSRSPRIATTVASGVSRRSFLRLAGASGLLVGGGSLLAACGSDDSPASGQSATAGSFGAVTMQLSWVKNVEFVGEYFAVENGYYADAGFDEVDLRAGGPAGTPAEAALTTGQAWIGISAPLITAPAILQGAELKLISATYQKNPFCIVSLDDNPIPDPQAMIGRRIGVGDSNELVWNAFLAANDIDPGEIERVPFQSDPTPITTGQIDGYMGYSTAGADVLIRRGFPAQQFLFADHGLRMVGENLVVSQDTIDNERDKLKAFLAATIRGWKDALADPDEATRLTVEEYGADQNFDYDEQRGAMGRQMELIQTPDTDTNGLFTITDELVADNVASLALADIDVDADQLFDLSVLDEVYGENPDLA